MSSPIQSAECVARAGASVEIELAPTAACGAHFPLSRFFALGLLHECALAIVYSSPGAIAHWPDDRRTPLARALGTMTDDIVDLMCKPATDPHKRVVTETFIAMAEYVRSRNWTPGADDLQDTFDRAKLACHAVRDPQLRVRMERMRLPHATLRIEATEAQWVSHVEVGMMWDVYAFDEAAPTWPTV